MALGTTVAVGMIVAALGACGGSGVRTAPLHKLPADLFGVNAFTLFNEAPPSRWAVHLREMQLGGIKLVRSDAAWDRVEPDPPVGSMHLYHWGWLDAIVASLARYRLRWYPIIDYSARWASSVPGNVFAPPANDADYVAFATALAKRYGPNGRFWRAHKRLPYLPVERWEIWNEESGWASLPLVDPASRYIDLYLAARSAIHAVDPDAQVVVGGLGSGGDGKYAIQFIASMYQHRPDARGQIDAIAYHPYPVDATETAASTMQLIGDLRNYLNSIGDQNVPIEITEVGWTTSGSGAVDDSYRAQQLTELIRDLASSSEGVTEFMPYTWVSDQRAGDGFGMFNWDGTSTLEGAAYLRAIRALVARPRKAERTAVSS